MAVRLRPQHVGRRSPSGSAPPAPAAARPRAIHALPAAIAPPVAMQPPPVMVANPPPLPQIAAAPRRPSYLAPPESSGTWVQRHTSFALSLVVHLLLLIGLAIWSLHEVPEQEQVVLLSEPAFAELENVVDIEQLAAESSAEASALASAGDLTDLPEAPEVDSLTELMTDLDAPVGFDFSQDLLQSDELLQRLGSGGQNSRGGGSGGVGPGAGEGDLMQFVQRLQRAGAKGGDVQISLIWDNFNDLDLHVFTPRGETIFFGHRRSRCRGELDVDMNAGHGASREPVENVYWGKGKSPMGKYKVAVHHYRNHGDPDPTPYELRVVVDGYTKVIRGEISFGSPRMIVYEFDRTALSKGPATISAPSPNDDFPVLSSRR